MPLSPGGRLGPYEIVSLIGEGGMGEVYKARDIGLNRFVAIKTSRAEFNERFKREAQAIAQLNHRNICILYHVESNYLVMEYVEGTELRGPLSLLKAIELAGQILDALDHAHTKGIVHRDLKPANIMVTKAGIKVLDFGLAKMDRRAVTDDLTTTALTLEGTIAGTLQYMAPEQMQAQNDVDTRADIFSFGCVFYEMLTGERAFEGATAASVIAAVMERPAPSIAEIAPAALDRLLKKCLEKDRDERWQSARDVKPQLLWATETGHPIVNSPRSRFNLGWVAAGVLGAALAVLTAVHFSEKPAVPQSVRFQIPNPSATAAEYLSLSPDGRMMAFVASNGGPSQIWVHALDTLEAHALTGTEGAIYPFWSPDSGSLGFFAERKLQKIAVTGGPAQTLCDAADGRGGTWNRAGVILFSTGPLGPIFRVSSAGGIPSPVTKIDRSGSETGHRFPVFLPDGVHFLYTVSSDKPDTSGLYAGSLNEGAAARILPDGTNAIFSRPAFPGKSGYLLFRRENTLMAEPFDPQALKATGEMLPVAEQVPISVQNGFGAFSASDTTVLAYRKEGDGGADRELVWMNRAGQRLGLVGKPARYTRNADAASFAISPDEKSIAVGIENGAQADIWLADIGRDILSRFTFGSGTNRNPVWSPDGSHLAYARVPASAGDLYQKSIGGSGQAELLLHGGVNAIPTDWSSDGKWIVFRKDGPNTGLDLWLLPLQGERKPVPYLQTAYAETNARFSPDGKWMAYESNESGRNQVYVQAVPPDGIERQISPDGGTMPYWRRDGKEIYYVTADRKLTAVPVKLGSTVEPGTPQPLFAIPAAGAWAPSRDGQRFLVDMPTGGESAAAAPPITIVLNWQAGLKK
jgi:Tol biopolymer transport system component/predicted Ser/Thr protein kinase